MKDEGEGSILDSSLVSGLGNGVDPSGTWKTQKDQLRAECDDGSVVKIPSLRDQWHFYAMTSELQE